MKPEQETALEALYFLRGGFPELDELFKYGDIDPIRFKRVTGYNLEQIEADRAKLNAQIDAAIAWVKSQS